MIDVHRTGYAYQLYKYSWVILQIHIRYDINVTRYAEGNLDQSKKKIKSLFRKMIYVMSGFDFDLLCLEWMDISLLLIIKIVNFHQPGKQNNLLLSTVFAKNFNKSYLSFLLTNICPYLLILENNLFGHFRCNQISFVISKLVNFYHPEKQNNSLLSS